MKFKTFQYADISTGELEESDLGLLTVAAPCCLTEYPEGAIFWTSDGLTAQERTELLAEMQDFGFSNKFVSIWLEVSLQGILYIRFDVDGAEIDRSEEITSPATPTKVDLRTDLQRTLGQRRVRTTKFVSQAIQRHE